MNQVWLAFFTGLTSGGISCFAVQGGLLASILASQKESNSKLAIASFLISKLIAYSILGALLGFLGSSFVVSPKLQGFMQILAGIFMLATVGKLLDLHPWFRKITLTPPKVFFRIVRSQKNSEGVFSPAVLGFLTVLIPCGVTQAMMLLSIASGSPFYGSFILGAFTLGTSPVFLILGVFSKKLLDDRLLRYAAITAILVLAIISINTGQILRGSVHTLQNYWAAATGKLEPRISSGKIAGLNSQGFQEVEIKVTSRGYQSETTVLNVGVPVKLRLITENTQGCSRVFTIPEYNISKVLPKTGTEIIEFTPLKTGKLTYTCSMGMFSGYFDVI